jgi:hypothetical protein
MSMQEHLNNCLVSHDSSRDKLSCYSGKCSTSLSSNWNTGVAKKRRKQSGKKTTNKSESLTSSNFLQMSVKALKMAFVGPVTVTMRSGQEPSEMFILAPDCKHKLCNTKSHTKAYNTHQSLKHKFSPTIKIENTSFPLLSHGITELDPM